MNPQVVSLDERREFTQAERDGIKLRIARYETALQAIMLLTDSREVFNLAAKALSEEGR